MRRCPVKFLCLPTHKRTCKCVHLLNRSISLPIPECSINDTILKAMSGTPSAMMKVDIDAIHQFLCAQARVTNVTAAQQGHCDNICRRIACLQSLDIPGATALTETVQAGPWTPEQKQSLASSIHARLDGDQSARAATGRSRRKLQTLSTLERYLTDNEIATLQDPAVCVLAATRIHICVHCNSAVSFIPFFSHTHAVPT